MFHTFRTAIMLSFTALLVMLAAARGCEAQEDVTPHIHHRQCVHDKVGVPLNKLPGTHVSLSAPPLQYTQGTSRTLTEDPSSHRPLRFRVVSLLDLACTEVGQVVPSHDVSGATMTCRESDVLTARKRQYVEASLEGALSFLSSALHSRVTSTIAVPSAACPGLSNEAEVARDADFVLFVGAMPSGSAEASTLAWGRSCWRDADTERPVIGQINFIPSGVSEDRRPSDLDVHVAMHEVTHALGFTSLFTTLQSYIDENGIQRKTGGTTTVFRKDLNKTVNIVRTPRVLREARRHFGCESLDGLEIEDMGGGGTADSHWKKRVLFEEALIGVTSTATLYYSSITLAFFEDKGFYTANYNVAEDNLLWGKNRGCDFLYKTCRVNHDAGMNEFCFTHDSSTTERCTLDRMSIGYCDATTFSTNLPTEYQYFANGKEGGSLETMDYCPAVMTYSNMACTEDRSATTIANLYGSEFGATSRCFSSNLITNAFPTLAEGARCFHYTCTESGQVLVRIQGQTVPCPADGDAGPADTSLLRGVHGKVFCPPAAEMCAGMDHSGLAAADISTAAQVRPPSMRHSPLTFCAHCNHAKTCKERLQQCKEMDLFQHYPLCAYYVHRVRECMGTDCPLQTQQLLSSHLGGIMKRCLDQPAAVASECADDWDGVSALCGAFSTSFYN